MYYIDNVPKKILKNSTLRYTYSKSTRTAVYNIYFLKRPVERFKRT